MIVIGIVTFVCWSVSVGIGILLVKTVAFAQIDRTCLGFDGRAFCTHVQELTAELNRQKVTVVQGLLIVGELTASEGERMKYLLIGRIMAITYDNHGE